MATEVLVEAKNEPGVLAQIGEALGGAGVNITAVCGTTAGDEAVIRLVTSDPARAQTALREAGLTVGGTSEALVLTLRDEPGALGVVSRKLAGAEVNIDAVYLGVGAGEGTTVVFAVDDLARARDAVS